ncbi:hypothetical protein BK120_12865 [Paenibacillus sp. FSL A5-0031]|uniref:hypothetical protein n=1 Tax=Paenibacillus sp. FSL A5-0031 TaxID=1920420 RepID=UPI00096CDAD6|nr:hypothetical protein [Paenibacillus sp. FSL A5-0031]OME83999.1 hypothetical protein BK120_12865 [Paenibacillus sp. FSL A5-0031]
MKKSRLYPFERNRYFYGKLLTVRDFESEQKYFNDKRRLLNRLLYGSGVLSGMQVVAVDDKTISVEMGVAIDYIGRELVIPSPVTLKLSMIEGFTNNEYKKNVYLCVAYDEKGKEPVHSVGNSAIRNDEVSEYNRVLESYRLFINEEAPAPSSFEFVRLLENVATIYEDANVRITQRMPKYVNVGEVVEVKLVVEKTLQTPRIAFQYDYEAMGFTSVGHDGNTVMFVEPGDAQETEYSVSFHLKAPQTAGVKAQLAVPNHAAKLTIGDSAIPLDTNAKHIIEVLDEPVANRILKDWHERSLEQAVEGSADQSICLAKISLLQMGPTYMIEKVDRVPFDEYIESTALLQRLTQTSQSSSLHKFYASAETHDLEYDEKPSLDVQYHPERNEFDFKLGIPRPQHLYDEISTGTMEVALESIGKTGGFFFSRGKKNYVSDEIQHGLGEGQVSVVVGLEEIDKTILADQTSTMKKVYYGQSDVFKGTEFEPDIPNVSLGTIVYPEKGTFRIGMKLQGETESAASVIAVRWWAFKSLGAVKAADQVNDEIDQGFAEAAASQQE